MLFCLMLATTSNVREINLSRADKHHVSPGEEITVVATVRFIEEACDEAPEKTSFFAKGARITKKYSWKRVDKHTFTRRLNVLLKGENQALITALINLHGNKHISQLTIPLEK